MATTISRLRLLNRIRVLPAIRSFRRPSSSSFSRLCTVSDPSCTNSCPDYLVNISLEGGSRSIGRRWFSSDVKFEGPAPVDYSSLLQEDEYHRVADSTIQDLLEKFEEYGDSIQIDGFDIDYGNQVLTLRLGSLGTFVLNKQAPNRQLWLSSPVSGPSRFDWDKDAHAWIYRRTKANLYKLFETELEQLCGSPINL